MDYKSPVYQVIAVPIDKVKANTYNPNKVAPPEMKLLYESIKEDGYTMPIVCYYSKEEDIYEIVDGFHRYRVMLEYPDIYEREGGMLPVSVIDMFFFFDVCLWLTYFLHNTTVLLTQDSIVVDTDPLYPGYSITNSMFCQFPFASIPETTPPVMGAMPCQILHP